MGIKIPESELVCVVVSAEYFSEGDYTQWQGQREETADMTYAEFSDWLVEHMRKYDSLVLYSDGTLYGNVGEVSYDISYREFDDINIFYELAEKFGIGDVEMREYPEVEDL